MTTRMTLTPDWLPIVLASLRAELGDDLATLLLMDAAAAPGATAAATMPRDAGAFATAFAAWGQAQAEQGWWAHITLDDYAPASCTATVQVSAPGEAHALPNDGYPLLRGLLIGVFSQAFDAPMMATAHPTAGNEITIALVRASRPLAEQVAHARSDWHATLIDHLAREVRRLSALATPVIPIADGVLIMPLIGTIDTQRAQQIVDTLLLAVEFRTAHTVLIDITGVGLVDTQVAHTLLRAAQVLRLLGTSIILTGVSPPVAQTLVTLGVDLGALTTMATVQQAVQAVLRSGAA